MTMYPCLNCLSPESVNLRLDKRGRPFTFCRMCTTRSFMHSRMALRGLFLLAPTVMALWQTAVTGTTALSDADKAVDASIKNGDILEGKKVTV